MDPLAIIAAITALLQSAGNLITEVIKSQPPDVQKTLWERHVNATQPLYDLLVKLESKIDPNVKP